MGLTDPNYHAHHLVPVELENHPFVLKAKEAGWDINHAYNGVPVPARYHGEVPGHPVYNSDVDDKLNTLFFRSQKHGWTPERVYEEIIVLDDQLRNRILTGIGRAAQQP